MLITNNYFFAMRFVILLTLAIALLGCSERTERVENKLNAYVQEDLKFIVAQTIHASGDRSGILDTPYYRYREETPEKSRATAEKTNRNLTVMIGLLTLFCLRE